MTIKEAIQQLERLKFSAVRMGNIELCNALYMAIRALERDGKYTLASALSGKSWRFVTSLPEVNKYDDITSPLNKKTRVTYHESTTDGTGVREIDDNLPSPPAVNFIPLMKI